MVMRNSQSGFTLVDVMITVAVLAVLAGAAMPAMRDIRSAFSLGNSARTVERELQTARLKAVSSNRPIRVRFNCPAATEFRMVELIGSPSAPDAADSAANRCSESAYPYPATDTSPLTRPNHDGPIRRLDPNVAFGSAVTLEFWPDGSVHKQDGTTLPWPAMAGNGTAITVTYGTSVRTITVNGLGKIQLLPE